MRRPAKYPEPSYTDENDRKLVSLINPSDSAQPHAVNIIGVPFEGAVLGRKGAAEGPAGVRQATSGFSSFSEELGVSLESVKMFDLGDVEADPRDVVKAHSQIEPEVERALNKDSLLVILGGDNSVSLPSLRACAKKFGKLGLVVLDSHLDLRGKIDGKPTSGSSYGLAAEEISALDSHRVVEVGSHGFLNARFYYEKAKSLGISVLTMKDVREKGTVETAKEAYETASEGADAVYVSIDLDALDLASVSGVSAPSVGGLSGTELSSFAYELAKMSKVRCADLVELAPSLDPTGKSERVAATVLVNLMAGFARRS